MIVTIINKIIYHIKNLMIMSSSFIFYDFIFLKFEILNEKKIIIYFRVKNQYFYF